MQETDAETGLEQFSVANDAQGSRFNRLILVAFAAVMAAAIVKVQPLLSANDRSRWCTVWSIVERGTYRIDEIDKVRRWSTIDKVYHDGHFYSTKPPLLATLVAGLYWCVRGVTGWDLLHQTAAVTRVILLFVNWLPMLIALIWIGRLLNRYARQEWTRHYVFFAAAFGTLLNPFLVTLNNHTVAAVSLVFALSPLLRILSDGSRQGRHYALAGFWSAFVCCNELPAALLGLAVWGMLLRTDARRTWQWFVPAALIPLSAFFVTNYLATGGWKPFYMYFGSEKYLWEVNGVRSYWLAPKGIDRSLDPPFIYFLNCTIGHHGILSLSPIYFLSLVAWLQHRHIADVGLRKVIRLGAVLTVCVLGFYLTRTGSYNYGGHTAGLRWMFWLIPFWLLAIIPVVDRWHSHRGFVFLSLAVLAVSIFSAFFPIENPWRHPWLFQWFENAGWIHYG